MLVDFRIGKDGNGTIYRCENEKQFNKLLRQYQKAGWDTVDCGQHGNIRTIEINEKIKYNWITNEDTSFTLDTSNSI